MKTLIVDENTENCTVQVLSVHDNRITRIMKFELLRNFSNVLPLTRPLGLYVFKVLENGLFEAPVY